MSSAQQVRLTFPGAGLAGICTSEKNREDIKKRLTIQTIGHDKINQLRHARFFKDVDGIKAHMAKHAALIRPKFELVENILTDEIASRGIGTWVKPLGGYFFGFEALSGCAKEIVAKCKEAGVTMTGAGSPFPYKKDPDDSVTVTGLCSSNNVFKIKIPFKRLVNSVFIRKSSFAISVTRS